MQWTKKSVFCFAIYNTVNGLVFDIYIYIYNTKIPHDPALKISSISQLWLFENFNTKLK